MRSRVAQRPPDLAIVSDPILGESVFSYLRRLSMLNGHRQFDTFSIAIGVGILRRGSSDKVWTRLAAATGVSLSDLAPMRWLRSEKPQFRQHTFLGDFISFGFALPKSNRYCVECLRENLILREFWAATYVIACPIHGIELTEACTCGRQHDNRKNGQPWHCICGKSFLEAPVVKAIPSAILAAQNMSHCAGLPIAIGANTAPYPKQLPTAFRDFNAHDYSAYLHTLGGAASLEASEDRLRNRRKYGSTQVLGEDFSLITVGKRIEAACEILETWPRGLGPLIDRLAFRGQEEAERRFSQAFSTRAGSMLRNPMRGSDGLPLRELHLELDAYWNNKYPRHKRRRNLSVVNVLALRTTRLFNARQLAFALGASHWKKAHSRVLARVVSEISDDEAKLNDEELAALIRTQSVSLYKDSQRSVSAGDAPFPGTRRIGSADLVYLHGALHLFPAGRSVRKLSYSDAKGALHDQVAAHLRAGAYPIFVSEGASSLKRPSADGYLREALTKFGYTVKSPDRVLFTLGHGLGLEDDHIFEPVKSGKIRKVFVGAYGAQEIEAFKVIAETWIEARAAVRKPQLSVAIYDTEGLAWGPPAISR